MPIEIGYHFTGKTLRDGRKIPKIGKWLTYDGHIRWCHTGLYFSRTPWLALQFARGHYLHKVELRDIVQEELDKGVCRKRKILCTINAKDICTYFARMQAIKYINRWNAPDCVIDYLMTGDKRLRSAAESAAKSAAWSAAWSAAESAAWSATWSASWSAAWSAAESAAWSADKSAAESNFNNLCYESLEC